MGSLILAYAILVVANHDTPSRDQVDRIAFPPVLLAFSLCAGLVTAKRPSNPIGWLLWIAALALAAYALSYEYAFRAVVVAPGSLPMGHVAAWLQGWVWMPMLGLFMPGLALFPDGTLPSPRWRFVVWFSVAALAACAAGSATSPGPVLDEKYVENPLGREIGTWAEPLGFLSLSVLLFTNAAAPVRRFRRSDPVGKQQLKWLVLSGLALAGCFPLQILRDPYAGPRLVIGVVFFGVLLAFPASITIAILRHGLFDIDLIINRTLVYGSLTATTLASYLALIFGFGWLLRVITGQGSSELAVAATTLIVAALFQPARHRIQSVVDRRFYRSRYDAAQTVEAFQSRLRDQHELEALRVELENTIHTALQPESLGVWLRPRAPGP